MIERVNKIDNTNTVRKVLEGTELSDSSIDLILTTLNEMQDKINNQVNIKLEAYVSITAMNNMSGEQKVVDRRVAHNEATLADQIKMIEQHTEKLENSRKRIQRLDNQLINLQRNTNSALESVKIENDRKS